MQLRLFPEGREGSPLSPCALPSSTPGRSVGHLSWPPKPPWGERAVGMRTDAIPKPFPLSCYFSRGRQRNETHSVATLINCLHSKWREEGLGMESGGLNKNNKIISDYPQPSWRICQFGGVMKINIMRETQLPHLCVHVKIAPYIRSLSMSRAHSDPCVQCNLCLGGRGRTTQDALASWQRRRRRWGCVTGAGGADFLSAHNNAYNA